MSNKMDAMKTLLPKLRFPEFQNSGEWEEKRLTQIAKPVSDKASDEDNDNILTLSGEHGLVLQSDYFGKKIAGDNVERYIRIVLNDFVYNDRTTKLSTYGSIKRLSKYKSGIVSPIYKCFRFSNEEIPAFWDWYFESGSHEPQLHGLVNEGARAGRFNISIEKFLSTSVWLPSTAEQQKIADCLTSLDDLIAAQSQKVEALQAYKKGLMQNLFPAEGESAPRLRFPEFESAGEWEEKTLGEVCNFTRGPFGGSLKKEIFVKSGYAVYEQSHAIYQNFDSFRYYISEEKFIEMKRFAVQPDDIIMSCSGTMGKFAIVPKDAKSGVINQALLKLTVKNGLDVRFIKALLELPNNQESLLSQSAGGAIQNVVSVGQIKELNLYIPSLQEQQRITELLTAIDEEISAQGEALAALKVHKRGLMQGLFPKQASEVLETSEV